MKLYELGLKRMELEYWSDEMVRYLVDHYKTMGDVEIMSYFKQHYPKTKGWKRNAIHKKRKQMNLYRTAEEVAAIVARNCAEGGPSFTIRKNSVSVNMHPSWIVQRIAWRNKELQQELLKLPEVIAAGKAMILLNRKVKSFQNNKHK